MVEGVQESMESKYGFKCGNSRNICTGFEEDSILLRYTRAVNTYNQTPADGASQHMAVEEEFDDSWWVESGVKRCVIR